MAKRAYRNHPAQLKADLLKRHHVDKAAVSELCNEHDLQPSVFYGWQNQLFTRAAEVLGPTRRATPSREKELEDKIARLEARIAEKDQVIAEVTEELVKTKKANGGP